MLTYLATSIKINLLMTFLAILQVIILLKGGLVGQAAFSGIAIVLFASLTTWNVLGRRTSRK